MSAVLHSYWFNGVAFWEKLETMSERFFLSSEGRTSELLTKC